MSQGGPAPEISVLVPRHGSSERLARLLEDLERQTADPGFEDDDFSLRVHLAGYRTRMALDVFVHHPGYVGPKSERHRKLLLRNWRRFVEKRGGTRQLEYGSYGFLAPVLSQPWEDEDLSVPLPGWNAGSPA